jgi:2-oxoglutarate dehydrogenase E1 component
MFCVQFLSVSYLCFFADIYALQFWPGVFLMKIILWQVTKINPNLLKLYDEKMLGTCKVNGEDVQRIHDKVNQILNEELTKSANYVRNMRDWLTPYCTTFKSPKKISRVHNTG